MLKNGTISQFTEAQTNAAQNEADNFGFDAAWRDYKADIETADLTGRARTIAFTWFVAGILVGKQLMLDHVDGRENSVPCARCSRPSKTETALHVPLCTECANDLAKEDAELNF